MEFNIVIIFNIDIITPTGNIHRSVTLISFTDAFFEIKLKEIKTHRKISIEGASMNQIILLKSIPNKKASVYIPYVFSLPPKISLLSPDS